MENIRIRDGVVYVKDYEVESFEDIPGDGGKVYTPLSGPMAQKIRLLSNILDLANSFQNGEDGGAYHGLKLIGEYGNEFKTPPHSDKTLKKLFSDMGRGQVLCRTDVYIRREV